MDRKLVAWARAVKRRRGGSGLPPLWLFTDATRMADPAAAVAGLPRGLCGVVFRHDGVAGRAALCRAVARVCRQRRLVLSVAGGRLCVPGALRHVREGWGRAPGGTSSAHGVAGLVRARRAGCAAVFLSPVFPTASHPGAPALGVMRWARMAGGRADVFALGGVDGGVVRRLPRRACGVGAIGALLADTGGCG